jgi:glycosyltransferase involved in cell wall biosynthesis
MDVSVIIPTYNRLWSLPDAVASCKQNACRLEIIVIDDGSSDGTSEWLSKQADVVSIVQQNWGKDNAVNAGFAVASGEFIRFLDSDDLLPPGANDRQLDLARRANADIVVGGYEAWYERDGSVVSHPWLECDDFIAQQLGECDSSHYSAYIFRKTFLSKIRHRQEFAFRDDRMFVIEAAMAKPVVAAADGPCLIHRHHLRDRIQFKPGLVAAVTNWQDLQLYTKASNALSAQGELTARRAEAIAKSLWPVAQRIAVTHMDEGLKTVRWLKTLDPGFRPPAQSLRDRLYIILGFRLAQTIVNALRRLRDAVRRLPLPRP